MSPGFHRLFPLSSRSENNCFLYGVFNGYDGNRVTNFVAQRLSAELLLGQLNAEHTEADVRRVLLQVLAWQLTAAGGSSPPEAWPRSCQVWVRQGWSGDPAVSSLLQGTRSGSLSQRQGLPVSGRPAAGSRHGPCPQLAGLALEEVILGNGK